MSEWDGSVATIRLMWCDTHHDPQPESNHQRNQMIATSQASTPQKFHINSCSTFYLSAKIPKSVRVKAAGGTGGLSKR